VLRKRLDAYHNQTAPLVDYYTLEGKLKTVDGMAAIPEVAVAIDTVLSGRNRTKAGEKSGRDDKTTAPSQAAKKTVVGKAAKGPTAKLALKGGKSAPKSAQKASKPGDKRAAKHSVKVPHPGRKKTTRAGVGKRKPAAR